MWNSEADRLAYLNYMATSMNVAISMEMLEINKLIYQSNEQRNKEILDLLKEIKDENKRRNIEKSI